MSQFPGVNVSGDVSSIQSDKPLGECLSGNLSWTTMSLRTFFNMNVPIVSHMRSFSINFPVVLDRRKPPSSWISPIFLYRFTNTFKPGIKKSLLLGRDWKKLCDTWGWLPFHTKRILRWNTMFEVGDPPRSHVVPETILGSAQMLHRQGESWFRSIQNNTTYSIFKHSLSGETFYTLIQNLLTVPICNIFFTRWKLDKHTHDDATNHSCIDTLFTICFITSEWVT